LNNRMAFLEGRKIGIGSSDVAAVLGLSPWKSALDVYLDKVEAVQEQKLSPPLEWGIRLEPVIAGAIIDSTGWDVVKVPTVIHRDHRFLIASGDRMRVGSTFNEAIEIKSTSRPDGWGEPETDEIPEHYWLQVQHQIEVLHATYGVEVCWVFVLIGHHDFRRYRVARDPAYLDIVLPALTEFWQHVENRTPPEPDWSHPNTIDAVQRLHQPKPGTVADLDAGCGDLVTNYQHLGMAISELEKQRKEAKARLIAAMGEAEVAMLTDGRSITRKLVERAGFSVEPTTYHDFRIRNPRSKK
jgi:putative phage-type endonuclease